MAKKARGSRPRMSGSTFPTMKVGPAPRPRGMPRLPAVEEAPPIKPSKVFPLASRSGAVAADYGSDAVALDDPRNYAQADDADALSAGGRVRRR
jgi:hypothetical protein